MPTRILHSLGEGAWFACCVVLVSRCPRLVDLSLITPSSQLTAEEEGGGTGNGASWEPSGKAEASAASSGGVETETRRKVSFPKSAPARFGCKQRKACNNTGVGYGGAVSTRSGGTPVRTVRAELACLSLSAASSTEHWFPGSN